MLIEFLEEQIVQVPKVLFLLYVRPIQLPQFRGQGPAEECQSERFLRKAVLLSSLDAGLANAVDVVKASGPSLDP